MLAPSRARPVHPILDKATPHIQHTKILLTPLMVSIMSEMFYSQQILVKKCFCNPLSPIPPPQNKVPDLNITGISLLTCPLLVNFGFILCGTRLACVFAAPRHRLRSNIFHFFKCLRDRASFVLRVLCACSKL